MAGEQCDDCVVELRATRVDEIRCALKAIMDRFEHAEQAPKFRIMALGAAWDGKGSASFFELAKLLSDAVEHGVCASPIEPLRLHQKQHATQLPDTPFQAIVYRPRRGKVGRMNVDAIILRGDRFRSRFGGNLPYRARRRMDGWRGAVHVRSGPGNPGAFITIAMTLA